MCIDVHARAVQSQELVLASPTDTKERYQKLGTHSPDSIALF